MVLDAQTPEKLMLLLRGLIEKLWPEVHAASELMWWENQVRRKKQPKMPSGRYLARRGVVHWACLGGQRCSSRSILRITLFTKRN